MEDYDEHTGMMGIYISEVAWWCARPLTFLIWGGVFERHPNLKVAITEGTSVWVPEMLALLDFRYADTPYSAKLGDYTSHLKMKPSEYVEKHCYFGIVRDPIGLAYHEMIPMDNVMFGSDFPHSVGSYPRSREFIGKAFAGLSPEIKRKVLLETPANYYGLDLDADITETPAA